MHDDQDTVDAQWSQLELEQQQRRQDELRKCADRPRVWLVSDELIEIDWSLPF
jgi:hypothetical protein